MKTNSLTFWAIKAFAALLLSASALLAQVEGPDGHYYQVVMEPGLRWEAARQRASELTFNGQYGHLATITSNEEDTFIETLRQQAAPGRSFSEPN